MQPISNLLFSNPCDLATTAVCRFVSFPLFFSAFARTSLQNCPFSLPFSFPFPFHSPTLWVFLLSSLHFSVYRSSSPRQIYGHLTDSWSPHKCVNSFTFEMFRFYFYPIFPQLNFIFFFSLKNNIMVWSYDFLLFKKKSISFSDNMHCFTADVQAEAK